MSLALLQNATAVGPNLTVPFSGIGGATPYSYSVVAGGAGGSVDPTTGLYTSPAITGIDTVQVTDALAATATAQIKTLNALELFCDVIQNELGLSDGRVALWDQKFPIPTDSDLFIEIAVISCKPFGNTRSEDGSGSGLSLVQSVNMLASLSIDIMSRGPSARDRKEEVILALKSIYSQQQQELNSFYIASISHGFVNLSQRDGAAIPYRFNISVNMQYFITKIKTAPYYSTFQNPTIEVNS